MCGQVINGGEICKILTIAHQKTLTKGLTRLERLYLTGRSRPVNVSYESPIFMPVAIVLQRSLHVPGCDTLSAGVTLVSAHV